MFPLRKKLACFFQCRPSINRRALCIKRSWDEVAFLLNAACCRCGKH